MAITEKIKADLTEAMKARDSVRLSVLRGILTAFTNELVATKRKPDAPLLDEEALAVITRQAKQRKDSIEQFEKGGRDDLVKQEQAELAIIEEYLPEMMEKDEIRKIVEQKKNDLGITDPPEKGKLMGAVMQELKGKADGGDVKAVVDELFT